MIFIFRFLAGEGATTWAKERGQTVIDPEILIEGKWVSTFF